MLGAAPEKDIEIIFGPCGLPTREKAYENQCSVSGRFATASR
jgi:hypothetical protein